MNAYDKIATPADWLCADCGLKRSAHVFQADGQPRDFTRRRYDFVAMLRVKNEERYIAETLEAILPLCARVFVMDDHSTDETGRIARRYAPKVTVYDSPFDGLNESRDKNWLYDQIIIYCEPEWILCIDGDEVLESTGPRIIREHCYPDTGRAPDSFKLKLPFMWGSRDMVRVDRIYDDFWRPSLFRPFVPRPDVPDDMKVAEEFRFKTTPFGRHTNSDQPNLHCSSVPQRRMSSAKNCPARLKHYGYMFRADRIKKLDYYTSIDWKNQAEDCYRHMCQGDQPVLAELPRIRAMQDRGVLTAADIRYLLDVPPEATLVHAGPLKVIPWDEDAEWSVSDWAKGQG